MAYIEVITTQNTINIKFNLLKNNDIVKVEEFTKRRNYMSGVSKELDGVITVRTNEGKDFPLCSENNMLEGALPVTSIDGTNPATNEELHDLLIALL